VRLAAAPVQKLVIFVFKNVLRHGEGVKEQGQKATSNIWKQIFTVY